MSVKFEDYSIKVKAEINDATIAWLYEQAAEVASHAARNCSDDLKDDRGKQLNGSYAYQVDENAGVADIGSPMEQAYWEEWGTGEHAAHGNGRPGWWIYIDGERSMGGGKTYATKQEAEEMAAYIRVAHGKNAIVTNGRDPHYTLEKAFKAVAPKADERLEQMLKGALGE